MTVELRSATFAPHVGEEFAITPAQGEAFAAVLTSCDETGDGTRETWLQSIGKVPFSLVFHALSAVTHPQQIFGLRHAELGEFALFLVPLGPDEHGMAYQAIIS